MVSVWGEEVSVRETPRTVMSGRYTSYWNAFLFRIPVELDQVAWEAVDVDDDDNAAVTFSGWTPSIS